MTPHRLIPADETRLDRAGAEIRILAVHALIVALVVVAAIVLCALHDLDAPVVSALLGSALTFGGSRSAQVSGRRRKEDDGG